MIWLGKPELVGIELEDLGVAVPHREADEARELDARLAEGARRRRGDEDLGDRVGAEALVRSGDGAVGDLDQHALVALVLDRATRELGSGEGTVASKVTGAGTTSAPTTVTIGTEADLGEAEELVDRAR